VLYTKNILKYYKPQEIKEDKEEFINDNDDVKQFLDDTLATTDNKESIIKADANIKTEILLTFEGVLTSVNKSRL
jgi:hypothetical protein